MNYLHWNEQTIADFSEKNISDMYSHGYVFTRKGKGVMQQTRSVRVDLAKFELSSENRRILKKIESLEIDAVTLPLREGAYEWSIGKSAKDFYAEKFGPGLMSAAKVKELLTDERKSNFNTMLVYSLAEKALGRSICYENKGILHYSYPFYELEASPKDMGLNMMIRAIEYAKKSALGYIYLGSLQRPGDIYKLQFAGLEWFDGGPSASNKWSTDLEAVKKLLKS